MGRFLSLLHKEWIQFRTFLVCTLLLCYVFSLGVPKAIDLVLSEGIIMQEAVFVGAFFGLFFMFIAGCYQFLRSMSLDVRQKEIWLHNSSSMYELVGVKIIFTSISMAVSALLYTIQFYFLKPFLTGTLEIFNLQLLISFFMGTIALAILVLLLFAFAFHKTMQHYIKGFAIITSVAFMIVVPKILGDIALLDALEVFPLSIAFLENYLPKFYSESLYVDFGEIYLGSELFLWALTAVGFVLACKWTEKVITK